MFATHFLFFFPDIGGGAVPPSIEVIGVCGPQVTNVFLFNGIVEPPFPVQRRTS
jgi:hypothetical protein